MIHQTITFSRRGMCSRAGTERTASSSTASRQPSRGFRGVAPRRTMTSARAARPGTSVTAAEDGRCLFATEARLPACAPPCARWRGPRRAGTGSRRTASHRVTAWRGDEARRARRGVGGAKRVRRLDPVGDDACDRDRRTDRVRRRVLSLSNPSDRIRKRAAASSGGEVRCTPRRAFPRFAPLRPRPTGLGAERAGTR